MKNQLSLPLGEREKVLDHVKAWLDKHNLPGMGRKSAATFARLDETSAQALLRCLSTRGPRKGQMKRSCPDMRKDALAWAAWKGFARGNGRDHESSIFGLMMLEGQEQRRAQAVMMAVEEATAAVMRDIPGTWANIMLGPTKRTGDAS